jgi:hypothetical protein
VFVTVHPVDVAPYDGFSSCDEIQFPLHMAMRAKTPELRDKFVQLLLVRYYIGRDADPLAIQRLPKSDYKRIRDLLHQLSRISSRLSDAIAVDDFD